MQNKIILLSIICLDMVILFFEASNLSISNHEANLLYGDFSTIQYIENTFLNLFGQNDIALRLPMMLFHLLSVILLYQISKSYIEDERNRLWYILIFILLPGVVSSALLVDSAGLVIFGLLLFIYIYDRYPIVYVYPLLLVFSFIDATFIYLFFSLIFYSLYKKDRYFGVFNLVLFSISLYLYGLDVHGSPKGHLLDLIGLYAAVFTPIIFVYIFYILYRRFLSKELNLLWFIAAVPLIVSLLLSFRQTIYIEHFAPYFIMALPIAAQTFIRSYRVRLKIFRTKYRVIFISSLAFLFINFFVVLFHRELYLLIENPKKHFARKMHITQELAIELKKRDIDCIDKSSSMAKRLRFYGIGTCEENFVFEESLDVPISDNIVTISYKYRPIYKASVTKINKK